jgi:hypothetical protein
MITKLERGCVLAALAVAAGCYGEFGETMRFRHAGQEFRVNYEPGPDGRLLREGSDSARIAALLSGPTAGYAPDPVERDLFWLYANDEERDRLLPELRAKVKVEIIPSSEIGPDEEVSCGEALISLFDGANYGGQEFHRGGEQFEPDLRNIGFDNRISSMKWNGTQVILYEHLNFGGRNISFISQFERGRHHPPCIQSFGEVANLRNYILYFGVGPFPGPGGGHVFWDNQATSFLLLDAR